MKVIHLSHSDTNGGAARAAYRIHQSLIDIGIESRMWVNESHSGDWTVEVPSKKGALMNKIRPQLVKPFKNLLKTENPILHSPAIFPSHWVSRINKCDADLVHLHWVQHEMLSVEDIGRIKKPIVWTLHDMWAFCGAEHYTDDLRWKVGYHGQNRPDYEGGFDLNRWTWKRKKKYWTNNMHIVTPSKWLANLACNSSLMHGYSVRVIPNALNTKTWMPIKKSVARELLHLSHDRPFLLFGAIGGSHDPRKGFDLLMKALEVAGDKLSRVDMEVIVFGQNKPENSKSLKFPVHFTGHLNDDISLRVVYSAADAMVVPSRQDNLPNTGLEAHACGTPVVAFDVGGLSDIIDQRRTGYLATPFDAEDLARGIEWVLSKRDGETLGTEARKRAEQLYDSEIVAGKYVELYKTILS